MLQIKCLDTFEILPLKWVGQRGNISMHDKLRKFVAKGLCASVFSKFYSQGVNYGKTCVYRFNRSTNIAYEYNAKKHEKIIKNTLQP